MKSKVAIVAANYYENITSDLVDGVKNNLNKSLPKDISFSGLSNIGSHTLRISASNSFTFVLSGIQPASTCACATSL